MTSHTAAEEKQPPKVINISFHTTGDWRLTKEEDEDINKFIKYLQENEISNEWKTNTYQHKLSSKASMAMSSIDYGRDKEIKELYQKSGLKEKDYKLLNLILREKILGKQRYNILVEIFRNKLKKEIKSEQEQAISFLTQGLYEYRVADEIIIEGMNKTNDPHTYFISAEGLSYIGDKRAEDVFLEVLKTDNYDFAIDALEGMDRLNWDREKLEEQARRFMLKAKDPWVKERALRLIKDYSDERNKEVIKELFQMIDFIHLPKREGKGNLSQTIRSDELGRKETLFSNICVVIRKSFADLKNDEEIYQYILKAIDSPNNVVTYWAINTIALYKTEETFDRLVNKLDAEDKGIQMSAIGAIRYYSKEKKELVADKVLEILKETADIPTTETVNAILFFYETYKLNFGEPHQQGKVPEIKKKIIEWYNSRKEK
ncbi:MAG: HEAT repeat domain-containing protein [Candidatus Omnitrophota bacterium]